MRFPTRSLRNSSEVGAVPRKPRDFSLVAGVCLFLLGLLCSFYLTFPDSLLRQRLLYELETRLPIQADLDEVSLRPLLTLVGKEMDLRLPGQAETLFLIDSFSLVPRWGSLLAGDPGLDGQLNSSAGGLSVSWQRSGPLAMAGNDFPFDIPLETSPAIRLSGKISTGKVTTAAPLQSTTESQIVLNLDYVLVKGLEALTANAAGLRLGEISLQMSGQGTSFAINRLEANGADLVFSGSGTLMLVADNPRNSRINLNLSLRAGNQADPTLASLLELAGTQQSDGSRSLRLTGTLAKPVIR